MKSIHRIIEEKRALYKSIGSIYCPILDRPIYFTADGFQHLLFKANRKARKLNERYMKLMALDHVQAVINSCTLISQTRTSQRKIKGKLKNITRYE